MKIKQFIEAKWKNIAIIALLLCVFILPSISVTADVIHIREAGGGAGLWEVDGSETQLIGADEIDMQTKKIINVVDPANNQDAATKKYVDDNIVTDHGSLGGLGDDDHPQYLQDVVDDTTPQLGGDLDAQGHKIHDQVSPYAKKTAAYTTTIDDEIIGVDTSFVPITITLGSAACRAGQTITIADRGGNSGANAITIATEGAETIDGAATDTINSGRFSKQYYSDGSNWYSYSLTDDHMVYGLLQIGTFANLPNFGTRGRLYYASDTKQLWRDNGSAWGLMLHMEDASTTNQGIVMLENPPTEDEPAKVPTSEWAFDHDVATTGVHGVTGAIVGTTDTQTLSNKTLGGDLDFAGYTAIALVCDSGATVPVTPTAGQWFLHTPTGRNVLMQYDGSDWGSIISLGAMTVYVDNTDGTDTINYGGAVDAGAFATISYAIDQIPPQYGGSITINVNGETYRETVTLQGKTATGAYSITLQGTLTEIVASQSVTSATANTLTKTGAGWGVNAYQNKLCKVTKSGQSDIYLWIRSNTATVLTLAGQWRTTVDNTWDFEILDRGTIISGADAGAPTTPVRPRALYVRGNQQSIYIRDIAVEYTSSFGIWVTEKSTASIYECKLDNCGLALLVNAGAATDVTSSYFAGSAHQFIAYSFATGTIVKSWIKHSVGAYHYCIRINANAVVVVYASLVELSFKGIVIDQGGVCMMTNAAASKNYIEDCTTGVRAELNGVGYAVSFQNFSGNVDDYLTATGGQIS